MIDSPNKVFTDPINCQPGHDTQLFQINKMNMTTKVTKHNTRQDHLLYHDQK